MKNVIGLAVGQRDIKLANISLKGRNVELLKLDVIEVPQGSNQYEIINLIKAIFKNNQLKPNIPICLSISAEEAFLKIISVKTRGAKRFKELVKDELKKNLFLPLENCLWDYMTLRYNPKEINNDVLSVAAKKEVVLDKLKMFEQSNGFVIDSITLDILAAYNCLKFNTDLAGGRRYALVDIASQKTQVFIFDDKDNFWSRTLPLGEDKFIDAISKKLGVSAKEAYEYKQNMLSQDNNFSGSPDDSLVALMKDVSVELDKAFNYYYLQTSASGAKDTTHKKIDEILLSGSGSLYAGLEKFLAEALNMPARYVYPLNKIPVKDKKLLAKKNLLGIRSSEFTTAVGLALTGLNLADTKLNLIKQTKKSFWQKIKLDYTYNILIVACVGLLVFLWAQKGSYSKEIKEASSKLKELNVICQQSIPQIDGLEEEYEKTDVKLKALNTAVNNRNIVSRIMYKISEIISEDVWLANFIVNLDYQNNAGELTISGKSLNYAGINKLISGLKDTGYFKTIQPVSSKVKIDEITKEEIVSFIIKLEIGREGA
ncbi:MAG: pilus assembly protein PilM [Candidatus Omnitrophica bacterium]|nr:pilus assembly protein PilM [Candidatus Omnitrophota bacterium]MDD5355930.1 pilus assembly protein PilM [Candidatus Omnitrophota bacterium]